MTGILIRNGKIKKTLDDSADTDKSNVAEENFSLRIYAFAVKHRENDL